VSADGARESPGGGESYTKRSRRRFRISHQPGETGYDDAPACFTAIDVGGSRTAASGRAQRRTIDEASPDNIKLCHRLNAQSITDDDLRFLQQIGLRWVRLEWGQGDITLDTLRAAQQRFAKFGMKIYSGVHYAYRSTRLQLGQAGRDQDIETYCNFVRDLGSSKSRSRRMTGTPPIPTPPTPWTPRLHGARV
jgi:hypothetical protein